MNNGLITLEMREPMDQIKIVLADDDTRLRSALRLRLEHEPDMRVVGEASNVGPLLSQVEAKLPDILLVDWELPALRRMGAGQQLVRTLRYWFPQLVIIALSTSPDAKAQAQAACVDAFVSKAQPADQLIRLCRATMARKQGQEQSSGEHFPQEKLYPAACYGYGTCSMPKFS